MEPSISNDREQDHKGVPRQEAPDSYFGEWETDILRRSRAAAIGGFRMIKYETDHLFPRNDLTHLMHFSVPIEESKQFLAKSLSNILK
jgi:hypothetical protein